MRRRSLLKAVGLGGLVGIGAKGGVAIAADADPHLQALVLSSPHLRSNALQTSVPATGTSSVLEAVLYGDDGAAVGRFHATRVVIQSGSALEVAYFDHHVFDLENGTLLGSGRSTRSRHNADEFAVVGGLGAFGQASGSYRMYYNGTDSGGDGSVRFEISLNGGPQWQ